MGLTTTEEVILIILAVALAIALILLVTVLLFVLKLIKSLRNIIEKAEQVVDSVGNVGDIFKTATGPFAAFKFIRNVITMVQKHKG